MSKSWEVVDFQRERFDAVGFLRGNYGGQESQNNRRSAGHEYYDWKLRKNPCKAGICKVVEAGGAPVGMATITPKRIKILQQMIDGAEIGDTFTHSDFQRQGIFSSVVSGVRSASLERGLNFIYGTPNDNSLPGYQKKLDFQVIPSVKVHNVIFPLKVADILKVRIKNGLVSNVAALIVSFGLNLIRMITKPTIEKEKYEFKKNESFGATIDTLWQRVEGRYDCILQRTQDILNWRFVENPDEYRIFFAQEGDETRGYVVLKNGNWADMTVGYVADIFCEDLASFNFLMDESIKLFQLEGKSMVSCWLHESEELSSLKKLGFLSFKKVPVICYKNEVGLSVLNEPSKWYFTIADSDNI